MKRTARSVVAVLLTTGLAFLGIGYGASPDFGFGGMTVNGGATGCCRDAI
jgi:hypothetical protein